MELVGIVAAADTDMVAGMLVADPAELEEYPQESTTLDLESRPLARELFQEA